MSGDERTRDSGAVVRQVEHRYGRRSGRDDAAAILLREIRERVPLCDDLMDEMIQRREMDAVMKPLIRRRGRGRAGRPA